MDVKKELAKIAADLDKSIINGKTLQQAKKVLLDVMRKAQTKTLYSDEYWRGPNEVMNALTANNVDWKLLKIEYSPDGKTKEWKFKIVFKNEKGVKKQMIGRITAFAAGIVLHPFSKHSNPFSKYDVIATID